MASPDEKWPTASFEEKYSMMMGSMSNEEQRRAAVNMIHLCQCSMCPTNTETGEINAVYCTFGKSEAIHEQKECLCSEDRLEYCVKNSSIHSSVIKSGSGSLFRKHLITLRHDLLWLIR